MVFLREGKQKVKGNKKVMTCKLFYYGNPVMYAYRYQELLNFEKQKTENSPLNPLSLWPALVGEFLSQQVTPSR